VTIIYQYFETFEKERATELGFFGFWSVVVELCLG
jgi:hypothetical protein